MMDFHSDVRRGLSHGVNTSTGSGMQGMSDDQSYTGGYGLPKKMIHSIASLVNPHAKMAESEAKKMEEEYNREQTPYRASSRISYSKGGPDLAAHIPVLRAVSVSGNRGDNIKVFNSFRQDHLYGQEILSPQPSYFPRPHTTQVFPPIRTATQSASQIHNQTLEEFYQAAENYCPTHRSKLRSSSRTQSAPAPRAKSAKSSTNTPKTAHPRERLSPSKTQSTPKLGKSLLDNKFDKAIDNEDEDEILYSSIGDRPKSAVKLEAVVSMIDQVKDEMNYFREKLAPTPMPGFRQPASMSVPNKPLSRPTSTASHRSRPRSSQVRPRSPSPQARPSSPQEADEILMGQPEVPADTFKTAFPMNRPHSATVSKAVDWRGKITPESARIRSKSRFGGHSYVQKLKPSLRTAGAVSAGKRPKTAPISMKERWSTKEKECDKNERVPAQAASNTMTQVDDHDMDRIMSIKHILGTSDSRYGSMGSLFLDEDFLRSMNSRYSTGTSMSHLTTGSQNREYLSFVAPKTPRTSPAENRSLSKQGVRKPDVNQIPEELSEHGEDLLNTLVTDTAAEVPALQLDNENLDEKDHKVEQAHESEGIADTLDEQEVKETEETEKSEVVSEAEVKVEDQLKTEGVTEVKVTEVPKKAIGRVRESVNVESEDKADDVHIEVTAVPATGHPLNPPSEAALERLTESQTWHFQPHTDEQVVDSGDHLNQGTDIFEQQHLRHQHHHTHHRHELESRQNSWAKSIVKPENYCFQCLPDSMSTKVGRSAGRMPGAAQSPAGQVLRMARRQNEYFKKAPPVRTPPSIPSTHHMHSGPSPRQGQQYNTELEHHARKVKSPRHFIEQATSRLRI